MNKPLLAAAGALSAGFIYSKMRRPRCTYPEESVSAAVRVGAAVAMPIHWGAFVLSNHGWDDPPERFAREAEKQGLQITTPHLCETVCIDDLPQTERWWREYR